GVAQVNTAMQQLDQVIQQNSAASEEMASTAVELSSQAELLQSTIGFFKMKEMQSARQTRDIQKLAARVGGAPAPKRRLAGGQGGASISLHANNAAEDSLDQEFVSFRN